MILNDTIKFKLYVCAKCWKLYPNLFASGCPYCQSIYIISDWSYFPCEEKCKCPNFCYRAFFKGLLQDDSENDIEENKEQTNENEEQS